MQIDELDAKLITMFTENPRVGVLQASRDLGVARGTVQARLDRLAAAGVIRDWGPVIDPARLGYRVTAFAILEITQPDGHEPVSSAIATIPEVLEVYTITGEGDLWCRMVARDAHDLQRVLDAVLATDGVQRSNTMIGLSEEIAYRTLPLVQSQAHDTTQPRTGMARNI